MGGAGPKHDTNARTRQVDEEFTEILQASIRKNDGTNQNGAV